MLCLLGKCSLYTGKSACVGCVKWFVFPAPSLQVAGIIALAHGSFLYALCLEMRQRTYLSSMHLNQRPRAIFLSVKPFIYWLPVMKERLSVTLIIFYVIVFAQWNKNWSFHEMTNAKLVGHSERSDFLLMILMIYKPASATNVFVCITFDLPRIAKKSEN